MKRSKKAEKITLILDDLYPSTPIPLNHHSAYTLLVAVMLSAQTTDKKVNEVTPGLFAMADTPSKMANLTKEIIIFYLPFTEIYIEYLFENLNYFGILFRDAFNIY